MEVAGEVVGRVADGLLVYLGVGRGDGRDDVAWAIRKISGLRIFEDERGRMARSVVDAGGDVLCVSQFTLFGDLRRGLRPSFDDAAAPELAVDLYERVCVGLRARGLRVETGRFGESMIVRAEVRGPVTIMLDSRKVLEACAPEVG